PQGFREPLPAPTCATAVGRLPDGRRTIPQVAGGVASRTGLPADLGIAELGIGGRQRARLLSEDERGNGAVRYPRSVPKDDACAKQLASRTLTNLYNERPTWLELSHRRMDE